MGAKNKKNKSKQQQQSATETNNSSNNGENAADLETQAAEAVQEVKIMESEPPKKPVDHDAAIDELDAMWSDDDDKPKKNKKGKKNNNNQQADGDKNVTQNGN